MKFARCCFGVIALIALLATAYIIGKGSNSDKDSATPESDMLKMIGVTKEEFAAKKKENSNFDEPMMDSYTDEEMQVGGDFVSKPYQPLKNLGGIVDVLTGLYLASNGGPPNLADGKGSEVWAEAPAGDWLIISISVANQTTSPLTGIKLKLETSSDIVLNQFDYPAPGQNDQLRDEYTKLKDGNVIIDEILPGSYDSWNGWTNMKGFGTQGFKISDNAPEGSTQTLTFKVGKDGYSWLTITPRVNLRIK